MAYSDYGGRVYRNGERCEDRCDAVLSPDGIKSTPGTWPGWTTPEGREGMSYHALIGDGPIFIGMSKQSHIAIYRLGERLDEVSLALNLPVDRVQTFGDKAYLNTPFAFVDDEHPTVFEVDSCCLEMRWTNEDNYYQYARLTQPDGTVWTAWSGYGVGAGLEDGDHGYDSAERDKMLSVLFPVP